MNDDIDYELVEHIIENGEEAFSRDWDSCGPSGAGCEYVYCWEGQYAFQSADEGDSGPYQSLEEALAKNDLLMVTAATTSIYCTEWTTRQLINRFDCYVEEDGFELCVNGVHFVYRATTGKFLRKPQPKKVNRR